MQSSVWLVVPKLPVAGPPKALFFWAACTTVSVPLATAVCPRLPISASPFAKTPWIWERNICPVVPPASTMQASITATAPLVPPRTTSPAWKLPVVLFV